MSISDLKDERCPTCGQTGLTRIKVQTVYVVTGDDELAEDTIWICECDKCSELFALLYERQAAKRYFK